MSIPKTKLEHALFYIDEQPIDINAMVADFIIETIGDPDYFQVWPEDGESGVAFYASFGDLMNDESLNITTEKRFLREIVYTHYIYDDDSNWERARILGEELKVLANELLESASRGEERWGNAEQN